VAGNEQDLDYNGKLVRILEAVYDDPICAVTDGSELTNGLLHL